MYRPLTTDTIFFHIPEMQDAYAHNMYVLLEKQKQFSLHPARPTNSLVVSVSPLAYTLKNSTITSSFVRSYTSSSPSASTRLASSR